MASHPNTRRRIGLTALVLTVALGGLVAGVFTRDVIASSGGRPTTQLQTPTPDQTATPQLFETPTPTMSPTVAPALIHFAIRLTASPNTGRPGDTVTITATATSDTTGQPVPGLTCHVRAPTDGEPALLSTWPAPTATNGDGVATWTVTIPSEQSGRYVVEVFAQTPAWSYIARTAVTVVAP